MTLARYDSKHSALVILACTCTYITRSIDRIQDIDIRQSPRTTFQTGWRSDKGFRFCARVTSCTHRRQSWLGFLSPTAKKRHRFSRKIRQTTRLHAMMCLFGALNHSLTLRPPFFQKPQFWAPFRRDKFSAVNGLMIIYTVSRKKTWQYIWHHNSGKTRSIFIISALL